MMVPMVPTGLVIMAGRIASNTAYFPLIAVEELPRNYNPNRGERVRRKLRLPESWKASADWCEPGFFERHFGFSANGIQVAAKMETPGILILEAPMEQDGGSPGGGDLDEPLSSGRSGVFLSSQAISNAMFTRMTRWAKHQPDAIQITVELVHDQAE